MRSARISPDLEDSAHPRLKGSASFDFLRDVKSVPVLSVRAAWGLPSSGTVETADAEAIDGGRATSKSGPF
jgi:hypothetical protein